MNPETIIKRVREWQAEVDEFLAWATEAKKNQIVSALKSYQIEVSALLHSLETKSSSFPTDFWSGDTSESKVRDIADRVAQRVSTLKLPTISASSKQKGESGARSRR